jgi:hypothetical protein
MEVPVQISDFQQDRPSGLFTLKTYRRGVLVDVYEDKNLVVDNYKQVQARLLGGSSGYAVTQFGVGTSATAPAAGNTALTGQFIKALDAAATYPATNQVSFAFSLAASEANGMAISEFGLFTAGNLLFARKTRSSPLNKDSDLSFTGTWVITY